MKKLLLHFANTFWNDEDAAKRWLWAAVGFAITFASLVLSDGMDAKGVLIAFSWTKGQLISKMITSFIGMALATINPVGKKPEL